MRYAGIIEDDVVNGQNVCVSFWVQGCPFHCKGCHNSQTWDFNGGDVITTETIPHVLRLISKNGIQRNFSILGGEPLCQENTEFVYDLISKVKKTFPKIKIFLWTGFELEELRNATNVFVNAILSEVDVLITGRFVLEQRDITLPLRGSRNQKILYRGKDF